MIEKHGVMQLRKCKLCANDSGIVVGSEYGVSQSLMAEGYNIATLMAKYWGVSCGSV